jgi:hypothetical protein
MAMSSDFQNVLRMTKLDGSNYRSWAFNMRLYLESFDLFGHVDESLEPPAEGATEAVKKAYRSAAKKRGHKCVWLLSLSIKFMSEIRVPQRKPGMP